MVNRLEVVVKFLATPRKEEDRQFQLDEVAQSLIDLGYKVRIVRSFQLWSHLRTPYRPYRLRDVCPQLLDEILNPSP